MRRKSVVSVAFTSVLTMALGLAATVVPAAPAEAEPQGSAYLAIAQPGRPGQAPFSDVDVHAPFAGEIAWAKNKGVTTGYPDGSFHPHENVSREASAAFFYRLAGSPNVQVPGNSPFSDVSPANPFFKEIIWAKETGVTTGYPDGTFHPKDPINRDAFLVFAFRLCNNGHCPPQMTTKSFAHQGNAPYHDLADTPFAREVTWAWERGIATGFCDGDLRPGTPIERNAVIAFLYRMLNNSQARDGSKPVWGACPPPKPQGYRPPTQFLQPVTQVHVPPTPNTLTAGMNGVKVRIAQVKLGMGYTWSSMNSATMSRVRAFQRRVGAQRRDGVVDYDTWRRLAPDQAWNVDTWTQQPQIGLDVSRDERLETFMRYVRDYANNSDPYLWGGAMAPRNWGADCSGMILQGLHAAGIDPDGLDVIKHAWPGYRTSQALYDHPGFMHVPLSQRQYGDLVFYHRGGRIWHVAVITGDNLIVEHNLPNARYANLWAYGEVASTVVRPFP